MAALSSTFKPHIGAALMYGHRILAIGFNSKKTHPVQKEFNVVRQFEEPHVNNGTIHAEMMCLLKAQHLDIDWKKAELFIYREDGTTHEPLPAKPCKACLQAIKKFGIKKVYYSTSNIPYAKLNKEESYE